MRNYWIRTLGLEKSQSELSRGWFGDLAFLFKIVVSLILYVLCIITIIFFLYTSLGNQS